jgi:hypothetical protein
VGWCVGTIIEANKDKRKKHCGKLINFIAVYEIDGKSAAGIEYTIYVYIQYI